MSYPYSVALEHWLDSSWHAKIANDLLLELEVYVGEKRLTIPEMRRFLAIKGCRDLLERMSTAREGRKGHEALKALAQAMRAYGLERPGLAAATFRTRTTDCDQLRAAAEEVRQFVLAVLAECGIHDGAADQALTTLRSLVRGFVLNELLDCFPGVGSYDGFYDSAIAIFLEGLSALTRGAGSPKPSTQPAQSLQCAHI